MSLSTRLRQIAAAIGSEGQFTASTLAAGNAALTVYEPKLNFEVSQFDRNPARASFGSLPAVIGSQLAQVTFGMDVRGAGTAGDVPDFGPLLRACGMSQTVNSGTASVGAVTQYPGSPGTGAVPVLTGTFSGTKSGILEILITAVTADTSIVVQATFWPADGTAASSASFTQNSAGAVALTAVAAGVSFDFGDPDASTTGYVVGGRYLARLVSDQEVSVTYKPISSSIPCLDLGIYQDGRLHKLHSCRGNVEVVFNEVGEPGRFNFTFMGVLADTTTTSDNSAGQVDTSLLSGIAYQDNAPPPFIGVTAELFSGTPQCFTSFSMNLGNQVVGAPCATSARGYSTVRINSRAVTGAINPRAAVFATANPFSRLFAGTLGNLELTVGSTAGNIVEITAPRVQVTNVTDEDLEGLSVDALELRFNEPEYDAGGDYAEFSITVR